MALTCRDATDALDEFVDGSLPPARRQALAKHVRECATCGQALKDVSCMRRLLRRLPRERMPDPMKNSLLDQLRQSRSLSDPARPAPHSHQHSSLRSRDIFAALVVALSAAACEVEERVATDAPRPEPPATVVTFHPTAPGPRHREVLPEWDIGVAFVRIPPAQDGPPGTAVGDTFPILAEPRTGAPLVARAFHREGQLEIEAARPGLVSGALEVGYEETALPALETGVGGSWVRVSFAFDSAGTAVTGWVDGSDSAVVIVSWTSWLADGAFFFLDADSIGFHDEPEGPVLMLALEPGQGSHRFDYTLYDIQTQGAWMQVRVASPSDYCVDVATSGTSAVPTGTNAWIRFLDEEGRPRIWYHTRGC